MTAPKRAYIREWALATGVALEWLEYGHGSPGPHSPGGRDTQAEDKLAALTERKRRRTGGSPTIGECAVAA